MEDRHNIRLHLVPDVHFVAVYDGHGGAEVADACAESLPGTLRRRLLQGPGEARLDWRAWGDAMRAAIQEVDTACEGRLGLRDVGSTVCLALFSGRVNKAVTANLGDSRMILLRGDAVAPLTTDHGIHSLTERQRIAAAGGVVIRDVFGMDRLMGILNLTRSVGDWYLRPYLSSTPDVTASDVRSGDALVVATDGLWDVIPTGRVPALAATASRGATVPAVLAREAMRLGSSDNITVVWILV